jgi:centromere protein C
MPFDDGGGDGGLYDEDAEMESPEPRRRLSRQHETPRRATLLGSEDESSPNTRSKGKRRAMPVNDDGGDDQVEDEIAQGLDDAEMQQEDEDEEVAEPPPKKKKAAEKRPRKKELPVVPCKCSFCYDATIGLNSLVVSPESSTGLRRGKRLRYEPLEWWRCEKVVYGRRDPGKVTYVPTIKEIVRIPKDLPKPLGGTHKGKRRGTRGKTEETVSVVNPEDGWDDKTATNGVVIDWFTGNEVSRRTLNISVVMGLTFSSWICRSRLSRSYGPTSSCCQQ